MVEMIWILIVIWLIIGFIARCLWKHFNIVRWGPSHGKEAWTKVDEIMSDIGVVLGLGFLLVIISRRIIWSEKGVRWGLKL